MAGFAGSAGQLKRLDTLQEILRTMEREPMKKLAQRFSRFWIKITRAFPSPARPRSGAGCEPAAKTLTIRRLP